MVRVYEMIYGTKTKRKQELIKAIKMKGKRSVVTQHRSIRGATEPNRDIHISSWPTRAIRRIRTDSWLRLPCSLKPGRLPRL